MKTYKHTTTFQFEGKRYYIRGDTIQEVAENKAKKLHDLRTNTIIQSPNMIVRQWADIWLKTYKLPMVSGPTYHDYDARLTNHILPAIGSMRLKDVKPSHLQGMLNDLGNYSKSYVLKVRYTLFQLLGVR
jgi:hypothetical protein